MAGNDMIYGLNNLSLFLWAIYIAHPPNTKHWTRWIDICYLVYSWCREGNGNSLQYSCLENPMDGATSWAAVHEVAKSQTRLKELSSSSSSIQLVMDREARRAVIHGVAKSRTRLSDWTGTGLNWTWYTVGVAEMQPWFALPPCPQPLPVCGAGSLSVILLPGPLSSPVSSRA